MKKKYSLDYDIERDTDRLHAIEEILDSMDTNPSPSELEQMASYILYGKDENGKNAVQRGETTDSDRRYKTFKRSAEKLQSLDEIMDNPLSDQTALKSLDERYIYTKKKPTIRRPKYDKEGNLIDIGDGDIPGMQELWDRIDYIERVIAANEGKLPLDDTVTALKDGYRLYQLRHQLIDMRRHQYYLKDSVRPTLHFLAVKPPQPQTYNWDEDSAYWMTLEQWQDRVNNALLSSISTDIDDYESKVTMEGAYVKWVVRRHHFDWENPYHIYCLIDNYSSLYMQLWDNLHSWGRTLIFDFDRYATMAKLSPVREYILLRKIDHATYPQIAQELYDNFGVSYKENHLSSIIVREIPKKIAAAARKHRLEIETPESEKKFCPRCQRMLPRNRLFFATNNSRKDHFATYCKECERAIRIEKGGQSSYDRRSKDQTLHEMQAREANS